ncbi:MAG: hypothetical protein ANABAC_1732 [Anaerolineae bacterium]|nr:MAG: hypothetical protein ANABAC_1732 [Anaerolineae bacterium]
MVSIGMMIALLYRVSGRNEAKDVVRWFSTPSQWVVQAILTPVLSPRGRGEIALTPGPSPRG